MNQGNWKIYWNWYFVHSSPKIGPTASGLSFFFFFDCSQPKETSLNKCVTLNPANKIWYVTSATQITCEIEYKRKETSEAIHALLKCHYNALLLFSVKCTPTGTCLLVIFISFQTSLIIIIIIIINNNSSSIILLLGWPHCKISLLPLINPPSKTLQKIQTSKGQVKEVEREWMEEGR